MKFKQLFLSGCIAIASIIHTQAQTLTINGSESDVKWENCKDVKEKLELFFFYPGSWEHLVSGSIEFNYKIELLLNGSVIDYEEFSTGDPEIDCYVGPPCPPVSVPFEVAPSSGAYQVHFTVKMNNVVPIFEDWSNVINFYNPYEGLYLTCLGSQSDHADNNCRDNMKIYEFEPGVHLVVLKNEGLIYKMKSGGTGFNMYAMTFNPVASSPGYSYYIGYQDFDTPISDIDYSDDGHLLIGFTDGKILKINGLGGGGQNMFAVNESSGGFSGISGYGYYSGHHKFDDGISDITCIGNYTIVSTWGGKILKVNGSGGSGANLFAITETSSDFSGLPGYPYYVGSAHFNGSVIGIYNVGTPTFLAFSNGKLLKINGTGGSGMNFMAVTETSSGFTGIPGYPYYIGAAIFSGRVTDLMYAEGTTTIGFDNGKLLKVDGTGGGGLNMFAIDETSGGFSGFSGYYYYLGHAMYSSSVRNLLYANGHTFVSFSNGKLLKSKSVGGTGANMYNATETNSPTGFATTSYSYGVYLEGSGAFGVGITDLKLFDDEVYLCFQNQKMFKVRDYGGTGYNCFNVAQTDEGFVPLADYTIYATGTMLFPCKNIRGSRSAVAEDQETVNSLQINVYPNPAIDQVTVSLPEEFSSLDMDLTLEMFNLNGQAVYTNVVRSVNQIVIPTGNMAPGIYLLRLDAMNTNIYSTKILKQ